MSHGHPSVPAAGHQPRRAEVIAGAVIIGLCVVIGALLMIAGVRPHIPVAVWVGLLALWLIAAVATGWDTDSAALPPVAYASAVTLAWVLVLSLAHSGGMIELILVVTATLGVYRFPLRVIMGVTALNTAVIVVAAMIRSVGLFDLLFLAFFYLMIQLAAVLSTAALALEGRTRRQLEEKNVELITASILLEDSARTAERLRISRELHDLIGHQLTVLNLELEAARHRAAEGGDEHVRRAGSVAKELLGDVRTTVGELRAYEAPDLQGALERIAQAVPHLTIRVNVDPQVTVDEDGSEALIRAAQEVMTNALKHSDSRVLSLDVRADEGEVMLTARSDGTGPEGFTEGNGIRGIRERFGLLGGTVDIDPVDGFRLEAHLPYPEGHT